LVQCTIRQNSQKTVKQQKMTIGVPIVTCLNRVRRIHKAAQMPLPCETSITCAWAVATARRSWAGLTLCVYMDVHASAGSRSLPRAATLVVQCGLCTTQPIISQNDPFISVQFVWLPLLVLGLSCRSLLLVARGSQFSVVSWSRR